MEDTFDEDERPLGLERRIGCLVLGLEGDREIEVVISHFHSNKITGIEA